MDDGLVKVAEAPNLPPWARYVGESGRGKPTIEINAPTAYPAILSDIEERREQLGIPMPPMARNQYWFEMAYQIAVLDVQWVMQGMHLDVLITDPNREFRQADVPPGPGPNAVLRGRPQLNGAPNCETVYRALRGYWPG